MRVEASKEARHTREVIILKHAPKTERPEETSEKLVLTQKVSSTERISELLSSIGHLRPRWFLESHEEGRAGEEVIEEAARA